MKINFNVQQPSRPISLDMDASLKTMDTRHNSMVGRDAEDAHPISAITGLQKELGSKLSSDAVAPMSNLEIENIINSIF